VTPRIRGNDYSALEPPEIGSWTPTLAVSVVVPAYDNQDKLDLTLAGLAGQTYPADLLDVIVVDNGSEPRLSLPELRPENTRLIVCDTAGRANARNAGLAAATGDVIHWLDSDIVLDREAVEAHMRWHHLAPYLVVTGYLRFTEVEPPAPEVVAAAEDLGELFEPSEPHDWIIDLVERTGGLRESAHRTFSLHIGGATSVNAALLEISGPMDDALFLGQDTEMGYRLAQAGAVFVPEPKARGFHLGPSMRMRDKEPVTRVSHAFIADRIPQYRWLRSHPGRQWLVPYVEVVVDAAGASYEDVRATVDAALAGTVPDVTVVIIGPWDDLTPERRAPLKDPRLDLVLIRGHYAHEGRVRLARKESPTNAPFRLRVPAGWAPGEDTLARLLDLATDEGHGLISVLLAEKPGQRPSDSPLSTEGAAEAGRGVVSARLERTAAFSRAEFAVDRGEDLVDAVEDTFGTIWVDGETYGFLPTSDAPSIKGRRSAYRARLDAEAEVARLNKEIERLKGQVTKWRDESGRWRKNAVEFRREIGKLRKEIAALKNANRLRAAVKRLPLATYAKRTLTRKPKT
jgi:glycosyltransferase involved in cell wall biosynthesis